MSFARGAGVTARTGPTPVVRTRGEVGWRWLGVGFALADRWFESVVDRGTVGHALS